MKNQKNFLILHNIRSVINVGAIFRTAECVGVSKIFLTGYTPQPLDRFRRARSDFSKASLGTENFIEWEYISNISTLINKLKKRKTTLIAVEQNINAVDYKTYKIKKNVVFIFGNEVRGLSKQILSKCDSILEITLRGKKESLNVATVAGIVLFRVLNV